MGLKTPELKNARAKMIIEMRTARNMSIGEVAKELNVSKDTVRRALDYAQTAGLFVQYEDRILQDIVPAAIEALKTALADGDGELAVKVLNNTLWAAQQKGAKSPNGASAPNSGSDGGDQLAEFMHKIRSASKEEEYAGERSVGGGSLVGSFGPLDQPALTAGEFIEGTFSSGGQTVSEEADDGNVLSPTDVEALPEGDQPPVSIPSVEGS